MTKSLSYVLHRRTPQVTSDEILFCSFTFVSSMPEKDLSNSNTLCARWLRLSFTDILKACGTALVPLMIGVMTLVTTLQQNKSSRENRLQDLQIAQATRQDLILSTYLNEMSRLMIDLNFTLNKKVRAVVVRPKTLTALNQLLPSRKLLLLEFLYESNLIRGGHTVFESDTTDLREADLKQVNFNPNEFTDRPFSYLWLVGTHLDAAVLKQCNLYNAEFESARMSGASFRESQLKNANFFRAALMKTDFTDANVIGADFTLANLTGSNITEEQLRSALSYHRAILPNGTRALYLNLLQNGDAEQCDLQHWQSEVNGTIEIRMKNQNCYFAANRSQGVVTMSQRVNYDKLRTPRLKAYYMQVLIDIQIVQPINKSSRVKLSKLFLDKNEFVIAQGSGTAAGNEPIDPSRALDESDDIEVKDLSVGQWKTESWVEENWSALQHAYWIELYVTFSHPIVCDNIGMFLKEERIFEDEQ